MALEPVVKGALAGKEFLWGAPTYDQCRTAWEELQHAGRGVVEFRESRMEAIFPSGGRVLFRSLDDPNNARSKTAHGFVMDEASFCHPMAWPEVIRPILSDTGGWALMLTTPHGQDWFWQEWVKAQQMEDSAAFQAPTLGVTITDQGLVRTPHPLENPHFPFAEAVNLYETLPLQTFKQEFLAEFVTFAGQFFPEWNPQVHLCPAFEVPKPWRRFGALDYGYAAPFCYLQFAVAPEGTCYVYRELYSSRVLDTQQSLDIASMVRDDPPEYVTAGTDLWHKSGKGQHGQSSAETYAQVWEKLMPPFRTRLLMADTDRLSGWRRIREWLKPFPSPDGASMMANLQIMEGRCPNLARTMPGLVHDEHRPEDLDTGGEDHACLIAGTMVATEHGPVPIEQVVSGDRVVTRGGLRRIDAAGMTRHAARVVSLHLSDGGTLTGTPAHRIWVQGQWMRLDELRYGDRLEIWRTSQTSTVRPGEYGERPMGPFRRDGIFITAMEPPKTTHWATWMRNQVRSIFHRIVWGDPLTSNTLNPFAPWPWLGTRVLQAANGIASTQSGFGNNVNHSESSVFNAGRPSKISLGAPMFGSVLQRASRPPVGEKAATISNDDALCAGEHSGQTASNPPWPVHDSAVRVVGFSPAGTAAVYNLTVEDQHEYYANGLLVKNCDTLRYGLMSRPEPKRLPALHESPFDIAKILKQVEQRRRKRQFIGGPIR